MLRDTDGFLLWNPEDRLDHGAMSKTGFAGSDRANNGADKPPQFTTLEAMQQAIQRRDEERRQLRGAA